MQKFDSSILKKNINTLMQNKKMTQLQLANQLGMTQPNLSKALSLSDKKCFTLEQVFSLASFFDVSIDELVEFEKPQHSTKSKRYIGEFIIKAVENDNAQFVDAEYIDEVPVRQFDDLNGQFVRYIDDKLSKYSALLFPNYWKPSCDEEYDLARTCGNDDENQHVNTFIHRYLSLRSAYNKGGFPEEAYRIVLDKYLDDLDKQTLKHT